MDSAKCSDKVPDSFDQVGEESKENGTSGKERERDFLPMTVLSLSLNFNRGGEGSMETGACSLGEEKPEFSSSQDSSHARGEFKRDSERPFCQDSSLPMKLVLEQREVHTHPRGI